MPISRWLFILKSWVQYWWRAQSDSYIHSPFVFTLYRQLRTSIDPTSLHHIEQYRMLLASLDIRLDYSELGSKPNGNHETTISQRYRLTSVDTTQGRYLYHLATLYSAPMLELGTSLAVSTLYMHRGALQQPLYTIDINALPPSIPTSDYFSANVHWITGAFDSILEQTLESKTFGLVFLDGNHTYSATISYLQAILPHLLTKSIVILHDIRYSQEMYRAWSEAANLPHFNYTIDCGAFGLLCREPNASPKQHFYIKLP